ncbi:hypothetical protein AYI68_g1778 [Smittium mucronatum]|uniref:Uncharacterized protein n=1 Tax=Smittium mucronatum TaxID=133383 RepID=A0A1R0H4J0_9FUNG|nr:hypothetical protein AYI68_g1778 [Smittium mucronatum]
MEFEPAFNRYDSGDESDSSSTQTPNTVEIPRFVAKLLPNIKIGTLNFLINFQAHKSHPSIDDSTWKLIGSVFSPNHAKLSSENSQFSSVTNIFMPADRIDEKDHFSPAYLVVNPEIDQTVQYEYVLACFRLLQPTNVVIMNPETDVPDFEELYKRGFYSTVVAQSALTVGIVACISNYCTLRNIPFITTTPPQKSLTSHQITESLYI